MIFIAEGASSDDRINCQIYDNIMIDFIIIYDNIINLTERWTDMIRCRCERLAVNQTRLAPTAILARKISMESLGTDLPITVVMRVLDAKPKNISTILSQTRSDYDMKSIWLNSNKLGDITARFVRVKPRSHLSAMVSAMVAAMIPAIVSIVLSASHDAMILLSHPLHTAETDDSYIFLIGYC